jgi:hypothetical protein
VSDADADLSLLSVKSGVAITAGGEGETNGLASITLDATGVSMQADAVTIADTAGNTVFAVDANELRIDAKKVVVNSEAGISVQGSIRTNLIQNEYTAGKGLTVESVGQDLFLEAGRNLRLESGRGSVAIAAFKDVKVEAATILLEGQVMLPGLGVPAAGGGGGVGVGPAAVGLCVCGTGTPKKGLLFQAGVGETCAVQVTKKAWGPCA